MDQERDEIMRALAKAVTDSVQAQKSEEVEGEVLSEADIVASRYMQRVLSGQKRCARELQSLAFEG